MKPPLMDLPIATSDSGFYSGFSKNVAVISKIIVAVLVIWAVVFPEQAGSVLNAINKFILANTGLLVHLDRCFVCFCSACFWPCGPRPGD